MSITSIAHGLTSTIFSNLFIHLPYPSGDLRQQTVIVTGSNTGLGLEASRHLVRLGVDKLVMGVRDVRKGEVAKKDILASTKRQEACIEIWPLDMDSYDSVKKFASRATILPRLDAVLANAGIWTYDFTVTEDNEKTITTNVVSTFLLGILLFPKLRQCAEQFGIMPRFVIVNSALHYMAPLKELDVEDGKIFTTLNDPRKADMVNRYTVSKLLVLFAVRELAARLKASEKSLVIVSTPNPSYCKSGLLRESVSFGSRMSEKILARSTEEGSRALVHGIMAGVDSHGQYLTNCHNQQPSSTVTDKKGIRVQEKLFNELMQKLEKAAPGISSNL